MRIEHDHFEKDVHCDCIRCFAKRGYADTDYLRIADAINELFSSYTGLGGYTIIFTDDSADVYCAQCAKRHFLSDHIAVTADVYYEGPDMYCDDCNAILESSYGDPDVQDDTT